MPETKPWKMSADDALLVSCDFAVKGGDSMTNIVRRSVEGAVSRGFVVPADEHGPGKCESLAGRCPKCLHRRVSESRQCAYVCNDCPEDHRPDVPSNPQKGEA